jgi:hypothetical protein
MQPKGNNPYQNEPAMCCGRLLLLVLFLVICCTAAYAGGSPIGIDHSAPVSDTGIERPEAVMASGR